jgi:hypothetical protein
MSKIDDYIAALISELRALGFDACNTGGDDLPLIPIGYHSVLIDKKNTAACFLMIRKDHVRNIKKAHITERAKLDAAINADAWEKDQLMHFEARGNA